MTFRLVAQCLNQLRYRVPLTLLAHNENATGMRTTDVIKKTLGELFNAQVVKDSHMQV